MRRLIIPNATYEPARFLWIVEPGDIILLDRVPSKLFMEYLCKIKKISEDSFAIITLSSDWKKTYSPEILLNTEVISKIKLALGEDDEFVVCPYIYDSTIIELANKLSLEVSDHWKQFVKNNLSEKLNNKVEFRKIAEKYNIPHSVGVVCNSLNDLTEAITNYLSVSGKIIVKQPYAGGTMGNVGIANHEYIFFGVHKSYLVNESNSIKSIAHEIGSQYINGKNNQLIVEIYYPHTQTITAILEITQKQQINLVNTGIIYFPKIQASHSGVNPFTGVQGMQMPAADISNVLLLNLINYSYLIAQHVQRSGYYGLMSVDAIVIDDQKILFTEANVRSGGETHINYLINKIFDLSELPFNNASIIDSSIEGYSFSIEHTLKLLDKNELLFKQNEGIIILSLNDNTKRLEYLVLSQDKNNLSKLQKKFLEVVELNAWQL